MAVLLNGPVAPLVENTTVKRKLHDCAASSEVWPLIRLLLPRLKAGFTAHCAALAPTRAELMSPLAAVTLAGGGKVADRFSATCTFVAGTVPVLATITS